MNLLRRVKKDLILSFTGLKEATLAIADRVNRQVREAKNSLEAAEMEQQIQMDQTALGVIIDRQPDLSLDLLSKDPEVKAVFNKIQEGQHRLAMIESRRVAQDPFIHFERTLIELDLAIQEATISDQFHGAGREIQTLSLPPEMRILLVRKKSQTYVPNGKTTLDANDHVLFICERENINKCKLFLN